MSSLKPTNDPNQFRLSWSAIRFIEAPSSKLLLVACLGTFAAVAAIFISTFFIETTISVTATGELDSSLGTVEAVASLNGQLVQFNLQYGERVYSGQVIGKLRMEENEVAIKNLFDDLNARVTNHSASSSFKPTINERNFNDSEIQTLLIDANHKMSKYKFSSKALGRGLELKADAETSLRLALAGVQRYVMTHEIHAPIAGRVVRALSVEGSLLKAGESVATIMPESGVILAKVLIPTKEISRVAIGSSVSIAVDAYPADKFGYFTGRIISLEAVKTKSSASSPEGYVARISIDPISERRRVASVDKDVATKDLRLIPGMNIEAQIQVSRAHLSTLITEKIFGTDR